MREKERERERQKKRETEKMIWKQRVREGTSERPSYIYRDSES